MSAIEGYELGLETDVSAFEREIVKRPVLQAWAERLPENFVVMVRK